MVEVKPDIQTSEVPAPAAANVVQRLYQEANTNLHNQPPLVPLNLNRMMVAPIQAVKAEAIVERIIKLNADSMRVDVPCGKKVCKCKN